MKHSAPLFSRIALAFLGVLFSFQASAAQKADFIVSKVEAANFPRVSASFTLTDATGKPLQNLQKSDFTVVENGTAIDPSLVGLTCDNPAENPEVNVILVLDKSSSMDPLNNGGIDRMEWVKYGAATFIDNLNFAGRTTVAVTSFGTRADVNANFTNNKQFLKDEINKIKAGGATFYNYPFLDQYNGVINLFKTRPEDMRKVVIFMTDGDPDPNEPPKTAEIIAALKDQGIQVYTIALALPTNDFLSDVAQATGGKTFNAYTREELAGIYKLLALESQISQICRLEWTAPYSCTELGRLRNVQITYTPYKKTENEQYTAPQNSIATLKPTETILYFGDTPVDQDVEQQVSLTAQKTDFLINDATIFPTGYYRIKPGSIQVNGVPRSLPLLLSVGQTLTMTVIFTQKEAVKMFRQAELRIVSSPCPQVITLVGGLSQVRLISPNGDDPTPFKTCDTIDIKWSGVEKTQKVSLYYSVADAQPPKWILIDKDVTGWSYKWKAPQAGKTYRIRVEVSQSKSWQWSRQLGSTGDDASVGVDVTADGYYAYTAGHFEGTMEIPTTPLSKLDSKGGKDVFVAKYDANGNILWAVQEGGYKDDRALALVTDPAGNVYVTGYQQQGAEFGTQTLTYEVKDSAHVFVAKYNGISDLPEWVIYSKGKSPTSKSYSSGHKIVYREENGTPYVYVTGPYGGGGTIQLAGVSTIQERSGTGTFILQIPTNNSTQAKFTTAPAGLKFPANPLVDFDANSNEYNSGGFTAPYTRPGIPDLISKGGRDAFISKLGGIPGSSDSSDQVFEVVAPVISFVPAVAEYVGSIAVGQSIGVVLKAVLKNTGTVDLLLDSARFFGAHEGDFTIISFPKGKILKKDSTVVVEIRFSPAETGVRTAQIVAFGSCGAITSLDLNGNGLPPCNTVAEPTIDFKTVGLNTTRTFTQVEYPCLLMYKGVGPATVKPVLKDIDGAFTMTVTSPTPDASGMVTLNPDQCLTATITFTPKLAKTYQATIEYQGLEDCGRPETRLIGEGLRPNLAIDSINWNKQRMGTKHKGTITLTNNDNVDATIRNIALSNSPTTDFAIINIRPTTVFPYVLEKNKTIEVDVEFTPTSSTGSLLNNVDVFVESFAEPLKGELRGFGVLPVIEARDTMFKQPALIGVQSPEQIILPVYNRSRDTTLFIEKITIIRNDGNDFILGSMPLNVSVVNNLPLTINFRPSAAGTRVLQLRITSDASWGSDMVTDPRVDTIITVTGEGVDFTRTEITDFKNTLTCETPEQIITFTNHSATQPLEITEFRLFSGQNNFTFTPSSLTIAPQGNATVRVKFTPGTAGSFAGTYKVMNSFRKDMEISLAGDARTVPLKLEIAGPVTATPGETIGIPVKMTTENYNVTPVTSLAFTLTVDPKLLTLKGVEGISGWTFVPQQISKGEYRIEGNGSPLPSNISAQELFTLNFDVYLATPETTPIEITEISTGNSCIIPESKNSSLSLGGVCFLTARPVQISTTAYLLKEVHPNPVSSGSVAIEFGVGIEGRTVINLYNAAGVLVMPVIDASLKTGMYETVLPLSDIPAGIYFYTMHSGPYSQTRKLVIAR